MGKKVELRKIQQDYKGLAKEYENRWEGFLAHTYGWVLARLENPGTIIDFGCGTGRMLKLIHGHYPDASLTGIDATPEMLEIARTKLPQATFIEADIEEHETGGTYDCVLSLNVLHHLNDQQGHIASLHRLCAADGTVFLSDFAIDSLPLWVAEQFWRRFHPAHYRAFSRKALRALIAENFTIIDEAELAPDKFWRLQIYQLRKR